MAKAGHAGNNSQASSWVARVIHLAFLAPDIAQAIVDGRQPPDLTAERLMRLVPLPTTWQAQREHLGL
jgi:site-specific DNA recombinase